MPLNNRPFKLNSQSSQIYDNTRPEVILVPPDTLDNKLRDFEDGIRSKGSLFDDLILMFTFLGILVTVSSFRDFMNVPGAVWQAVFVLLLIFSIVKLLRDLYFRKLKNIDRKSILDQLLSETRKRK